MTQPQKIQDKLKPVFNRGGGSKNAATRESAETQSLEAKPSVRVATTENINLSGLITVDGIQLISGDRVLVKDQTTGSLNGIYIVSASSWVRSNDANSDSKVNSGMIVFVQQGSSNADTGWFLTTDGDITLNSTSLNFKRLTQNIDTEILQGEGIVLDYNSENDTLTISSNVNSQVSTEILEGSGINLIFDQAADTLSIGLKLENKTPSSSSDVGVPGQICYDNSYVYICTAQNSWRRFSHSNW